MSMNIEDNLCDAAENMRVESGDHAARGLRELLYTAASVVSTLRAERDKWRIAATVLCGEHIGAPQPMCPVCEARDDRERLRVAVDPIRSWFDGDGEIDAPLSDVDMAATAVQDLLADRDELIAARAALKVEREACDEWRRVAWKKIVEGYDLSRHFEAHDARRAAEAKE